MFSVTTTRIQLRQLLKLGSSDFGGCSFERSPVVYREPLALSRTRVLPLDHRVRTDRAVHKSWAVRERGTTLLSRDVLRVT